MNRAQRIAARDADANAARLAVDGIVVAQTRVTIGARTFHRGQPIGGVADVAKAIRPENFRALLSNRAVEIRPA